MAYRLPFKKEELRLYLENETVFKRSPKLTIDMFVKNFFPETVRGNVQEKRGASETSSDTEYGDSPSRPSGSVSGYGGGSRGQGKSTEVRARGSVTDSLGAD